MKKLIFTLITLFTLQVAFSQTTYYWVGGAGPVSFTANSNWNTALDGTGTPRAAAAATDILVFSGLNIGGTTPTTGPVTVVPSSTALGRLILQDGADVAFTRTTTGTGTVTIGAAAGDAQDALVVFSGCKLRLKGTTGGVLLLLNSNAGPSNSPAATTSATGRIYGEVIFEEATPTSSNVAQNRFTSRFKGALVFTSGSSFTTLSNYLYYPFGTTGSSTTPAAEGVVFEDGASFYYGAGSTGGSPFGSNSTSFLVKFLPGSKFYFRSAPTSNMFGGRKYADVIVENNATVTANGSLIGIDSLRVEPSATFITNTSGVTPISGNVVINGTFKVPDANPDRENKVIMTGSTEQTISGTGTFSLADFIISDVSTVKLQKNIVIDSITRVIGDLTPGIYGITGAGTISEKAPATHNITGNLNTDSFLVKNISDFTGIEVGMSVSGTNIPANTVVTNTSSSSGTVTLSKAVTGSVTYGGSAANLTVFNGQGVVLPVKLGAISAFLQAGKAVVKWEVITEQNIGSYIIERSANTNQFTSVGTVAANNSRNYNFVDAAPLAGVSYYRIKVVSRDGNVTYSNMLKVNNGKNKQEFAIYPNPVEGKQLNISLSGLSHDDYSINVYNVLGQPVLTKTLGTLNGSLNTSVQLPNNTPSGIYKVIIRSKDQNLTQSVLIQ